MKFNQIRDVLAVAERGSFRSAARHLGLAQPAITRSIRELEHELDVTLFERHVTGTVLTPMGSAFIRRAAAIQLELQRTRDELQQLKGMTTGSVTFGLSTAAHVALLPKVLRAFARRFPDVRLKLMEGLFPTVESDLHDGMVDFYVGPLAEDAISGELKVEKLFDNHRIIIARKGNPLVASTSLKELTAARWVAASVTIAKEAELNPVFLSHGLPLPIIAIETHTALSLISAVASSDYLGMLPRQWVALIDSTDLLQRLKLSENLTAPAICMVRRAKLPLTPAAEHLADLFRRAAMHHAENDGAREI